MASEQGCPIEMHRIEIDRCDEMYDEACNGQTSMPFHRASYDSATGQSPNSPREQVGEGRGGGHPFFYHLANLELGQLVTLL